MTPHLLSPKQINFISWVLLNLHHHHSPCTSNSMYYYLEIFSELAKRWPTSRKKQEASNDQVAERQEIGNCQRLRELGNCLNAVCEQPVHPWSSVSRLCQVQIGSKVVGNCLKAVWEQVAKAAHHWWSSLFQVSQNQSWHVATKNEIVVDLFTLSWTTIFSLWAAHATNEEEKNNKVEVPTNIWRHQCSNLFHHFYSVPTSLEAVVFKTDIVKIV